jgi:exodeoxyribonuclease VII large subunit
MIQNPPVPAGVKVFSVGELTQEVKGVLEDGFASVWVAGEISNLSRPNSGHVYLTLKDAQASLRTVVYRGVALRLRFDLRDGQEVVARGRINVYAPQGIYQLSVEEMHPRGVGAAELALRQLKEKLLRLGYFDPKRKRPLPLFPRQVALVTSATGAAVRDMLEVLARRWPVARVVVRPVRVQGDGAAGEIAAAIQLLNRLNAQGDLAVEVMIVGRGGGSLEDLWPFNEERVAQAIFDSRIPVVSAVGHEIDVTVADLVADKRAVTPTEAATIVAPDLGELLALLGDTRDRLEDAVRRRLDLLRSRLDELAGRRALRRPLDRLRDQERRLDELSERLHRAARLRQSAASDRLAALAARLETLSPLNVLARGYSLTRTADDGSLVRDAAQVRPGDRLRTVLARGAVVCQVEATESPENALSSSGHGGPAPSGISS